jgi:hypothetical protein
MNSCSGVTVAFTPSYEDKDTRDIIEALVVIEGRKSIIPGMDQDDIAQEIRMECIRVLEFYDSSRIGPSPYKYLQTCIKNFIYNMKRGIWVPNNPPCTRCPLWDRVNRRCTIDEVDCDKIIEYRASMARKADLKRPASLEIDICEESDANSIVDLDLSIRNSLPENLILHYNRLIKGEKVPARAKRNIRLIVTQIINDAENI